MENRAAVACDIDAAETGIEFDDIWSVSKREKGNCCVLVQIEDGHQIVLFTSEKRAVMLRVQAPCRDFPCIAQQNIALQPCPSWDRSQQRCSDLAD